MTSAGLPLVLTLALSRAAFAADPVPLGADFHVNPGQEYYAAERPDAAGGSGGNFVVVWQGGDGLPYGSNYPIFARTFGSGGAPTSGNVEVSPPHVSGERGLYPAVAADDDGNFVVLWNDDSLDAPQYSLAARLGDAGGTLLGPAFEVAKQSYEYSHDVARYADGSFVVVWGEREDGVEVTRSVHGRRYDATGGPQAGPFPVKDVEGGWATLAAVAPQATGGFVATWGEYPGSGAWTLRGQRFDASNAATGAELLVTTNADGQGYSPPGQAIHAVASNATGDFVVAWPEYGPGLSVQRYDSTGAPVGPELEIVDATGYVDRSVDIALEDDGDFIVVWDEEYEIMGRHFSAADDALGDVFQVNSYTTNDQREPTVASTGDGRFVVAWEGYGDADTSGVAIFARRFTVPTGVGITGTKLVIVDKQALAGRAKVVYVSKLDPGIDKGAEGDPAELSGTFEVFYTDASSVAGSFVLPSPWQKNIAAVAKYVNTLAPGGAGDVKVALLKNGTTAKVAAKGLGDGPAIDLFAGPPSASGGVTTVLTLTNGVDDTVRRFCTRFATDAGSEVVHSELAQGAGRKLVAKGGVPTPCP
jgi:hypothetical protein